MLKDLGTFFSKEKPQGWCHSHLARERQEHVGGHDLAPLKVRGYSSSRLCLPDHWLRDMPKPTKTSLSDFTLASQEPVHMLPPGPSGKYWASPRASTDTITFFHQVQTFIPWDTAPHPLLSLRVLKGDLMTFSRHALLGAMVIYVISFRVIALQYTRAPRPQRVTRGSLGPTCYRLTLSPLLRLLSVPSFPGGTDIELIKVDTVDWLEAGDGGYCTWALHPVVLVMWAGTGNRQVPEWSEVTGARSRATWIFLPQVCTGWPNTHLNFSTIDYSNPCSHTLIMEKKIQKKTNIY